MKEYDFIKMINPYIFDNSFIGCLLYDERTNSYVEDSLPGFVSYSEIKYGGGVNGRRALRTSLGDNHDYNSNVLDIISYSFSLGDLPTSRNLIIDYRLLNNDDVLEFLRFQYSEGNIFGIRIIGDNFVLDEETYAKINFLETIKVAKSSVRDEYIINNNIIQDDFLFSVGINSDLNYEIDYFIRENMSNEEISELIYRIDSIQDDIVKKISLRFYNPVVAVELIKRLDAAGLSNDVEIEMLGYPLTENVNIYEEIEDISNKRKINVTYVCCHDLLNYYCNEPFDIGNFYISELEPGATTSLDLYVKTLKVAKEFENSVENIDSNIEKTMLAYQYLNDNYYYALNSGEDDYYDNTRNLDLIMDRDDIVCVGFANLLTLMCRRVGIPMFTYGAPGHRANVARIIEKDDFGNVILDKICTFDATNDCGYYDQDNYGNVVKIDNKDSYTFFGLDPEIYLHSNEPSHLTLANSLALPPSESDKFDFVSKSCFSSAYSSFYKSDSFRYSMLRLMGYIFDDDININDLLSEIQERGLIGEIPQDMILKTARNIEKRKYYDLDEIEFETHMDDINNRIYTSFDYRNDFFSHSDARINLNICSLNNMLPDGQNIVNVCTFYDKIDNHEYVDLSAIDIGPILFEDLSDLPSGNNVIEEEVFDNNKNNDISNDVIEVLEVDENENIQDDDIIDDNKFEVFDEVDSLVVNDENIVDIMFTEDDFSDVYMPGTNIRMPRAMCYEQGETEEEYADFLKRYCNYFFPGKDILNSKKIVCDDIEVENEWEKIMSMFNDDDFLSTYVGGTFIRKPRYRKENETQEEYIEFLEKFYKYYFPYAAEGSSSVYSLKKDQIVQDLPIYSTEVQIFNAVGMSDEEIENIRTRLKM